MEVHKFSEVYPYAGNFEYDPNVQKVDASNFEYPSTERFQFQEAKVILDNLKIIDITNCHDNCVLIQDVNDTVYEWLPYWMAVSKTTLPNLIEIDRTIK